MLDLNEHLIFKFKLDSKDVTVEGIVRSKEILENHASNYDYRIEFVHIESAQQEKIIQYVFYIQREMIKRMKSDPESEFDEF